MARQHQRQAQPAGAAAARRRLHDARPAGGGSAPLAQLGCRVERAAGQGGARSAGDAAAAAGERASSRGEGQVHACGPCSSPSWVCWLVLLPGSYTQPFKILCNPRACRPRPGAPGALAWSSGGSGVRAWGRPAGSGCSGSCGQPSCSGPRGTAARWPCAPRRVLLSSVLSRQFQHVRLEWPPLPPPHCQ